MTPAARVAAAREELLRARAEIVAALKQERGRRRGALNRHLHEIGRMLAPDRPYRSQAGQDAVTDALLGGRRGGSFADIGGYDGITGSNTLFFEQNRGWSGVLVEPVPRHLSTARAARRCRCIGCAVAPRAGEAEFIEITEGFTQMSGLAESYDTALLDRVRADPRHAEAAIRVETRTLADILTEAGHPHPDFVSLDIEGGETAVLESFPFAAHDVAVWAIENNDGAPGIARIMRAAGYELAEFCGPDEIYVRRDLVAARRGQSRS